MDWGVSLGLICFGQEILDQKEPNLGQTIKGHAGQYPSEGTLGTASTLMGALPQLYSSMVRV